MRTQQNGTQKKSERKIIINIIIYFLDDDDDDDDDDDAVHLYIAVTPCYCSMCSVRSYIAAHNTCKAASSNKIQSMAVL